jgi:hypothetical protein
MFAGDNPEGKKETQKSDTEFGSGKFTNKKTGGLKQEER